MASSLLAQVPDGTTVDDVMELVMFDPSTATPTPDMLSFEELVDAVDTTVLSPDQTEWIAVDLAPGAYAMMCFIPDLATKAPHAAHGMIRVFVVQ